MISDLRGSKGSFMLLYSLLLLFGYIGLTFLVGIEWVRNTLSCSSELMSHVGYCIWWVFFLDLCCFLSVLYMRPFNLFLSLGNMFHFMELCYKSWTQFKNIYLIWNLCCKIISFVSTRCPPLQKFVHNLYCSIINASLKLVCSEPEMLELVNKELYWT